MYGYNDIYQTAAHASQLTVAGSSIPQEVPQGSRAQCWNKAFTREKVLDILLCLIAVCRADESLLSRCKKFKPQFSLLFSFNELLAVLGLILFNDVIPNTFNVDSYS